MSRNFVKNYPRNELIPKDLCHCKRIPKEANLPKNLSLTQASALSLIF